MSLHGYHYSVKIGAIDPPFESLIMAAMRKADSDNAALLRSAFPQLWRELKARYDAPGGVIPEDGVTEDAMAQTMEQISKFRSEPLR